MPTQVGVWTRHWLPVNDGPFGPFIQVGDMKMTSVSDVYAASDITRDRGHTGTFAKSVGVMAGLALNRARASGGAS